MPGLPYDQLKLEIISYLNAKYPNGITIKELRAFRVPGPRRESMNTNNELRINKGQIEFRYGDENVSRKAIRHLAEAAYSEGLLTGWKPLDIGLTAWYDETTFVDGAGSNIDEWTNHPSALGDATWDFDVKTFSGITHSTINGVDAIDFDGLSYLSLTAEKTITSGTDAGILIVWESDGGNGTLLSGTLAAQHALSLGLSSTLSYQRNSGSHAVDTNALQTYAAVINCDGTNGTIVNLGGLDTSIDADDTGEFKWGRVGNSHNSGFMTPFNGRIGCIGFLQGSTFTEEQVYNFLNWSTSKYGTLSE
jgi:hypothetical protein